MIKIIKPDAPQNLITRGQAQTNLDLKDYNDKTEQYNSGVLKFEASTAIYNSDIVRQTLELAHHNKCCYCETKDVRSNKDVEHFRPKRAYSESSEGKSKYPGYFWLAYDWENLFLACQVCNQIFKNDFFPIQNENFRAQTNDLSIENEQSILIHPSKDNPEEHIGYREHLPYGITERGNKTIYFLGFGKINEDKEYSVKQRSRIKLLVEEREKYYREKELIYKLILIFESKDSLNFDEIELLEKAKKTIAMAQNNDSEWSSMIKCAVKNEFKVY
ncbi:hypothetical protein [Flavobacterium sp.]|uniref:hypothetical protein n=1 Tax=Flavobacterium sp. TaxID=239 RepID=UPI00261ACEF3|nr:hypothetical protein [Flavobacterium sp.]